VRNWGDEGHRLGWCLYEMGCKGSEAHYNCPTVKYNAGASWPVQAGHPCFACASNNNWDVMGSIYTRLPNVPGASYRATADKIGLGLAALTGAGVAAHAIVRGIKGRGPGLAEGRNPDAGSSEGKESPSPNLPRGGHVYPY
jgi:hydrogenase small subunit